MKKILSTPVALEILESRIAPAAIQAPGNFTYTDGNGDLVKVTITGHGGTAQFLDGVGADLTTSLTGDIAKVIIDQPGPDFAITFTDLNVQGGGDNVISLGTITGPNGARVAPIKGIFTSSSSPGVDYELTRYLGTSFSSGGGLQLLGHVVGDGVTATSDVDILSLGSHASLLLDSVDAGATVHLGGKSSGILKIHDLSGDLSVGSLGGLTQIEHIAGTATVRGDITGALILGSSDPSAGTNEEVTIQGSVRTSASIQSVQNVALHVAKNFTGTTFIGGDLNLDVAGNLVGANIKAGGDITLGVTGLATNSAVIAGQQIHSGSFVKNNVFGSNFLGGTGTSLDITGTVTESRISSGTSDLGLTVSGSLKRSQLVAGGDAEVTIGFSVIQSSIDSDGRLDLTIGQLPLGPTAGVGDVKNSTIGSKSTSATVSIGGKVLASQFTTATDMDLQIGSSLGTSELTAGNDLTLSTGTTVLSTNIATGSDADVTIGGKLASSTLLVSNNLNATIGKSGAPVVLKKVPSEGLIQTRIETSDGSSDISVIGAVRQASITSGQSASLTASDLIGLDPKTSHQILLDPGLIAGSVKISAANDVSIESDGAGNVSPQIAAGQDVTVDTNGRFSGAVNAGRNLDFHSASLLLPAVLPVVPGSQSVDISVLPGLRAGGDLSFHIDGNVSAAVIQAGGNVTDFSVGGDLNAKLRVGGNFVAGTTSATAVVVGGAVSPSTFLYIGGNVGDNQSSPELKFAHGFAGELKIEGDLLVDLTFGGGVKKITVGGKIGPAALNGPVVDVTIGGALGSFVTTSIFNSVTSKTGNFVDAGATVIGVLTAQGGIGSVGPV